MATVDLTVENFVDTITNNDIVIVDLGTLVWTLPVFRSDL